LAIFYHYTGAGGEAKASKAHLESEHSSGAPIVTQIIAAGPFYRAENTPAKLEKRGLSTCHIK